MSISAFACPLIAFGQGTTVPAIDYNPEIAPSLAYGGLGVLDPRPTFNYQPGQNFGSATTGFLDAFSSLTVNYIPSTLAANNICAAQLPVANVPMTLVSSTGAGITVGCSIINWSTGNYATSTSGATTVSTVLGIDVATAVTGGTAGSITGNVFTVTSATTNTTPFQIGMTLTGTNTLPGTIIVGYITGGGFSGAYQINQTYATTTGNQNITGTYLGNYLQGYPTIPFGTANTIQMYNPTNLISRAVTVTTLAGSAASTFLVSGYDVYGVPMTQLLTSPGGAQTLTTTKAFKFINSIVPSASDASHNVTVGTADVYGFPMRSDVFGVGGVPADIQIYWNGALITANTGYLAAVTTSPATSTTGDVRGTYAVQSAANGTKALQIIQSPSLPNTAAAIGLFGVTQA